MCGKTGNTGKTIYFFHTPTIYSNEGCLNNSYFHTQFCTHSTLQQPFNSVEHTKLPSVKKNKKKRCTFGGFRLCTAFCLAERSASGVNEREDVGSSTGIRTWTLSASAVLLFVLTLRRWPQNVMEEWLRRPSVGLEWTGEAVQGNRPSLDKWGRALCFMKSH